MSVKSALIDWLNKYPDFTITDKIMDEIVDGKTSYGVSKEPIRIVNKFIDGSLKITEYYSFFAKRMIINDKMRKNNDDFFVSLEDWIHKQQFPSLGEGLYCDNIEIENGGYLLSVDDRYGMYSLTIRIEYRKE